MFSPITLDALRNDLAILHVRLDAQRQVELELTAFGHALGRWTVSPADLNLPTEVSEVAKMTSDALSKTRTVVDDRLRSLDPLEVVRAVTESIEEFSRLHEDRLGVRLIMSLAAWVDEATDVVEDTRMRGVGHLVQRAETYQQQMAEFGVPVKPEDLATARDVYTRIVDAAGTALSGALFAAERRLDIVTQERADWLRQRLPNALLPERIAQAIELQLQNTGRPCDCLWVELESSAAYLPLVPWEKLLAASDPTPRSIARMPYHSIDTDRGTQAYRVLLWCTAPSRGLAPSSDALLSIIDDIVAAAPAGAPCLVHVFADSSYRSELEAHLASGDNPVLVHAYEPDTKASWFDTIRTKLEGRAVDVCHLVVPAHLSLGGEPLLVVPATPPADDLRGAQSTTFLRANEVANFACGLGAAAMVLTCFRGTSARFAGRLFCDQVARARPGTVALHDLVADSPKLLQQGPTGLSELYQFLVAATTKVPRHPGLSIYCHPATTIRQDAVARPSMATPGWAESIKRYLEYSLSGSMEAAKAGSAADEVAYTATRKAVDEIARLLEESIESSPTNESEAS